MRIGLFITELEGPNVLLWQIVQPWSPQVRNKTICIYSYSDTPKSSIYLNKLNILIMNNSQIILKQGILVIVVNILYVRCVRSFEFCVRLYIL
jgi:hypothetical protein